MEYSSEATGTNSGASPTNSLISSPFSLHSPTSPSSPPTRPSHGGSQVVVSPCAACKILRRRCADNCVLAPYFPPNEPAKFTIAHRVFGASNIIKFLQELPESQRADAVSSMVYEASSRIRDPVYGCAGAICQLQRQVNELQAQLAKAQAEVVNMQCQQANLVALLCMEMTQSPPKQQQQQQQQQQVSSSSHQQQIENFINSQQSHQSNVACFLDENNLGAIWEPLWT